MSIKHKQSEDQDAEGFQKVLHFGSVSVGCTMERQIRLYNPSMVCTGKGWASGNGQDSGTPSLGMRVTSPLSSLPSSPKPCTVVSCLLIQTQDTHVCINSHQPVFLSLLSAEAGLRCPVGP